MEGILGPANQGATDMTDIADIAELIAGADHIAVNTGAGVSAESGIPTFRDALEGLWAKYDPQELATPEAYARDPELVTRWYDERRQKVLACAPNPGHHALAQLEALFTERKRRFVLLTQNVDGLHVRAGSRNVVEVHGSLITWRCTKTGATYHDLPVPFDTYPPISDAGGPLRPGVVWFGESLPADALEASFEALSTCDVYLAIGTSGVVFPAAGFVEQARSAGATTVEINLDDTPMTRVFHHTLRGKSGELLPALVEQVRARLV